MEEVGSSLASGVSDRSVPVRGWGRTRLSPKSPDGVLRARGATLVVSRNLPLIASRA